jgi:hypothetical protein
VQEKTNNIPAEGTLTLVEKYLKGNSFRTYPNRLKIFRDQRDGRLKAVKVLNGEKKCSLG